LGTTAQGSQRLTASQPNEVWWLPVGQQAKRIGVEADFRFFLKESLCFFRIQNKEVSVVPQLGFKIGTDMTDDSSCFCTHNESCHLSSEFPDFQLA
jgi:hypothetical protein